MIKVLSYGVCCTAEICSAGVEITTREAEKQGRKDIATALRKACVDDINGPSKTLEQAQMLKQELSLIHKEV